MRFGESLKWNCQRKVQRAWRDRWLSFTLRRRVCFVDTKPIDLYASLMFEITNERFEVLVGEALAALPAELSAQIENLAIIVDDQAPGRPLFGLYEGIPLTKRGPISYSGVMPDRITLYQTTICRDCTSEDEVKTQIRKTVVHEVAHHFGISDPRLEELGWA